MLGIYISGHPLDKLRDEIKRSTTIDTAEMLKIKEVGRMNEDGKQVKYAGIITSVKKKYTRNNTLMAFAAVEDLYGSCEIIVFEKTYISAQNILMVDNVVLVDGRLSLREDEDAKIVANNITLLNNVGTNPSQEQVLWSSLPLTREGAQMPNAYEAFSIDITNLDEPAKAKLRGMMKFFSGDKNNTPIQVTDNGKVKPCGTIYMTEEIKKQFEEFL